MKPCVVFLHIPPLVWVVHTRKRCGFWICANKSDARYTTGRHSYTTGRHSLSVDRCVRFLPFLQRSISDLCQLEYPKSLNNPPLEMYRKGFFCHLCLFSFLTAFSARSATVFFNFAVANLQIRRHCVFILCGTTAFLRKSAVIFSAHAVESVQKRQRLLSVFLRLLGRLQNRLKRNCISQPFQFLPKH